MSGKQPVRVYGKGLRSFNRFEANSYRAMKERCLNPNYRAYSRYGGRGIKICDRWLGMYGFLNFLEDMGKKPTPKHTLDRVDNDGDYTPDNCRWADQKTQVRNSKTVVMLEYKGENKLLLEWCEIYGIDPRMYRNRKREGWSDELIFNTPKLRTKRMGKNKEVYLYA